MTNGGDDLQFTPPDGAAISFVTQGDPIRSFIDAITPIVKEAHAQFTDTGLEVRAVDPANVSMVQMNWPAAGFTAYNGSDVHVGMPFNHTDPDLRDAVAWARRGRGDDDGDPVRVDVYDDAESTRVRVAVLRPDQRAKRVSWFFALDPDVIRSNPDIPELELPYRADPEPETFIDAIGGLDANKYVWFGAAGRTFIIATHAEHNPTLDANGDGDRSASIDTVELPDRAWTVHDHGPVEHVEGSLFSHSYIDDYTGGLRRAASRLTVSFGDELPAQIEFQHTDWGFDGTYMVAPRIRSDDDV
jgi:proliferating cell nuclear antigen